MACLSNEQKYDLLHHLSAVESLGDVLDVLGNAIDALALGDAYLVNLLDASGNHLVTTKIRYAQEFQSLEKTYLGYKSALNDNQLNARSFQSRQIVRITPENASETEMHVIRYWKVCEIVSIPIIDGNSGKPPIGTLVIMQQQTPLSDIQLSLLQEVLGLLHKSLASWLRYSHLEEMHDHATVTVERNKGLLRFLDEMNSLTSLDKIYDLFSTELFKHLPFDVGAFALVENNCLAMYKVAAADPKFEDVCSEWRQYLQQTPYPLDPTLSGAVYVLLKDEPLFFPDLQQIMHLPMTEHDAKNLAILKTARTLFISPVRYQKKPIGIFALYNLSKPVSLSETDLYLLGHLSSFLGTAVTNSKIYAKSQAQNLEIGHLNAQLQEKVNALAEQASTDQLTGLFNFRTFEKELEKRLTETERASNKTGLSLIIIDIDHFKRFNDTHGHAAGNDILAGVAREIGRHIRQTDMACRYGGEEFVVILPKCDRDGAALLAERIRAAIEVAAFPTTTGVQSVTVSIGCAMHVPGDNSNAVFARADRALYEAKAAGRNRVCGA